MIGLVIRDGFAELEVRCDTCGDRIRHGNLANVVWDEETGETGVFHKGHPCDPGWPQWEDLDCTLGYLFARIGLRDVIADARERGWRDPDTFREAA